MHVFKCAGGSALAELTRWCEATGGSVWHTDHNGKGKKLKRPEKFPSPATFFYTFLRDPLERFVSAYHEASRIYVMSKLTCDRREAAEFARNATTKERLAGIDSAIARVERPAREDWFALDPHFRSQYAFAHRLNGAALPVAAMPICMMPHWLEMVAHNVTLLNALPKARRRTVKTAAARLAAAAVVEVTPAAPRAPRVGPAGRSDRGCGDGGGGGVNGGGDDENGGGGDGNGAGARAGNERGGGVDAGVAAQKQKWTVRDRHSAAYGIPRFTVEVEELSADSVRRLCLHYAFDYCLFGFDVGSSRCAPHAAAIAATCAAAGVVLGSTYPFFAGAAAATADRGA
ncbi:unnamed protein product [Phaeothamnion confervicola]